MVERGRRGREKRKGRSNKEGERGRTEGGRGREMEKRKGEREGIPGKKWRQGGRMVGSGDQEKDDDKMAHCIIPSSPHPGMDRMCCRRTLPGLPLPPYIWEESSTRKRLTASRWMSYVNGLARRRTD